MSCIVRPHESPRIPLIAAFDVRPHALATADPDWAAVGPENDMPRLLEYGIPVAPNRHNHSLDLDGESAFTGPHRNKTEHHLKQAPGSCERPSEGLAQGGNFTRFDLDY